MPDEYIGNETNSHSPSASPGFGSPVTIQIPVDLTDPLNASTFNQPPEVLADWVAFLRTKLSTYRGVRAWDVGEAYLVPSIVVYTDGHLYKAIASSTGSVPPSTPSKWTRIDYTEFDMQTATIFSDTAMTGVTCSHGATCSISNLLTIGNGQVRVIMFTVSGVPWDGSSDVDLSGSTTKFNTVCDGGICGLISSGWQYGGTVGVNKSVGGDPNVCTVFGSKSTGSPETAFSASVVLFGQ